ncbi:MAG TPA: AI-2E family transporter [Phycisphaerae bacterium]|nr:AI-2E family transporter [Phycisphaerae bacterium]HRW51785.1 AI-2E family transporter [Phycisphaerae bacterium]
MSQKTKRESTAADPMVEANAGETTRDLGQGREDDARRQESVQSEKAHSLFRGPIDIRSVALTGVFLIAAFHTLFVARAIFIPLVLAVLLSLMLRPPVRWLNRAGIPDSAGSGLLLSGLSIVLAFGFYWLSAPAATWLNELPRGVRKIEQKLHSLEDPIKKVKAVSDAVEKVADVGESGLKVQVRGEGLLDYLLGQTQGVMLMSFLTVAFLFFLLASGDSFLRKLVRVLPRLREKKQAVEIVHKIQNDIATYIFSITVINTALGIAIALAMYALKLPNPALWGVMAFFLNFVPYLGALTGVAVVGVVAIIEGDTIGYAVLVMAAYYGLTTIEGTLVTPMILGHRLRLSPVVVFLALIVWGWLWGIPGALLAVPILATFKILCDQLEPLHRIGEFLER